MTLLFRLAPTLKFLITYSIYAFIVWELWLLKNWESLVFAAIAVFIGIIRYYRMSADGKADFRETQFYGAIWVTFMYGVMKIFLFIVDGSAF